MTRKKIMKKVGYVSAGAALAGLAWFAVDASTAQDLGGVAPYAALPAHADDAGSAGIGVPLAGQNPAASAAAPSQSAAALRARMRELQASLAATPTTAAEQAAQQQAITELAALQTQLQRQEAEESQYSAYRKARDAQRALENPDLDDAAGAEAFGVGPGASRQDVLDASGLSGNNLAARTGAAAIGGTLTPSEAALLREQKEGLTAQYRQLQQTLRALQPGDEALAASLREEQATILAQLRDVESRLERAAVDPAAAMNAAAANMFPARRPAAANPIPGLQSNDFNAIPAANQLNLNPGGADDLNMRTQKANQAALLLQEAGLVQLAGHVMTEIPRMAAGPDFKETPLVEGTWTSAQGMAEENNNPFHMVGPKDIDGINNAIGELKAKIDALSATLADVETQLKLLTRQQVNSGYVQPAATTVPVPAPAPAAADPVLSAQPAAGALSDDVFAPAPAASAAPAAPVAPAVDPDADPANLVVPDENVDANSAVGPAPGAVFRTL